MTFSDAQIERYARHIILPEIGGIGQEKLAQARVLIVGAGGLGSPALIYLAAAGIGTLGIIDDDVVDLSNLQRQIAHVTARLGRPKVDSAAETVAALNPDVHVERHPTRLTAANAAALIGGYDLVLDGSDNFPTRYLVADACHLAGITLISAALLRFDAQISTFKSHLKDDFPCYRCLYPHPPAPGAVPSCAEAGVLGAVAGMAGSLQAIEAVKELLGIGDSLAGHLLLFDALGASFRKIRVHRDPDCALCGTRPTLRDLSGHAA